MPETIEILAGVARQGKTSHFLDEYRAALRLSHGQGHWGRTLWITPTQRAQREVLACLPDISLPVLFSPHVMTFDAFAETVLKRSDQNVTAITEIARRTLLRSIIGELRRNRQLNYFSPIAETNGFLNLVGAFVSELKRDEIWPEHFETACRQRGQSSKDRELSLIYAQYQKQLLDLGLYDSEGRFWSARTALNSGRHGEFSDLSLVVVDGFTDFTQTQYEILAKLAEHSDRLIISLPLEEPLSRYDLFAKTDLARARIEQMGQAGPGVKIERLNRREATDRPAFDQIAEKMFANPRTISRLNDADGIEILATTGQLGEMEALAQKVKQLLLSGTSPDDIVIAFRTLDDSAELIDEIFPAFGLPYWCESGRPLSKMSLAKALFTLLQLEEENWPFERLMAVLDSSYFRPGWDECREGLANRAVAAQLRQLKIHADRRIMLRALERSASQAQRQDQETDSTAKTALALLQRLSLALEPMRKKKTLAGWAESLVDLATALGIAPTGTTDSSEDSAAQTIAGDRETWELFRKSLFKAVEMTSLCRTAPDRFDLTEFMALLRDLVLPERLTPQQGEQGRVRILSASQVRSLDIPHLFLAGLTESSFPHARNDDCIYNEAERRGLNAQGLTLAHRRSQSQDEMLLFYGVVTRARVSLTLSYPALSASGQPLFPSPYVAALQDLFTPEALPITHVGQLDPVPPRERIYSAADLRLVAMDQVLESQPALFRAMAEVPENNRLALNILAGIEMSRNRFAVRGFTPFEGMLENRPLLKALRGRFPDDHQFSATGLESYAACPFRFFLSDVLKIEPLESPRTGTDFLSRGRLVHNILAVLHGEHAETTQSDPFACKDRLIIRFRELVSQHLQRRNHDTDLQEVLANIEEQLLHEWASAYGDQCDEYLRAHGEIWDAPPHPTRLETGFGNVPGEEEDSETETTKPLTLGSGKQQTLVRGRIDRIDVGQIENRQVFNIIDYKTGRPPKFSLEEVQTGVALQLALYTLAVRRLQLAGAEATPYQMGYWCIRDIGFVPGMKGKPKPLDEALLHSLETVLADLVPQLAERIRAGVFPVASQDPECTGRCPYHTVCRVNQIRAVEESLDKRVSFHRPLEKTLKTDEE